MAASSCSAISLASAEPLPGTASRATALLVLEVRKAWPRDVLEGTALGAAVTDRVRAWVAELPGSKVLFVRRPDRRSGPYCAFVVHVGEHPSIRRLDFVDHDELRDADLEDGVLVDEPLALVCGHARRDRCCARLGVPLFDALRGDFDSTSLWLSSHQGGHRFAANLLWLPEGLAFGRVAPAHATELVADLRAGLLPTANLRGRIALPPESQAAEIATREALGLGALSAVSVVTAVPGRVRLATALGEVEVRVESQPGPLAPVSCGAEPEPTLRYVATVLGPGA
jgi:hypothetical protein